jgi:hypothetical protein
MMTSALCSCGTELRLQRRMRANANERMRVYLGCIYSMCHRSYRLAEVPLPLLLLRWLSAAGGGAAQLHSPMAASVHIANCKCSGHTVLKS